jgi:4-diphosphocytidyl-2-C-methyl-D-erythritol kinase
VQSIELDGAVRVQVPGKVNLSLSVGPRRADGYHELVTLFMAVSLYDHVTATPARRGRLTVEVSGEGADSVPTDMSNLALKAADLLRQRYGTPELGAHLAIEKRIPVAGGMAGGSADGAAALLACSVLWDLNLGQAELLDLAAELGSDVPFALLGGCALGTGRGEKLAPALCKGTYEWVFALSHGTVSTPAAFKDFDSHHQRDHAVRTPDRLMKALASHDLSELRLLLHNDLQSSAQRLCPGVTEILDEGPNIGGLAAMVSGSGPTIAFLCADTEDAIELTVGLSTMRGVRAVHRAKGPAPGARVVTGI